MATAAGCCASAGCLSSIFQCCKKKSEDDSQQSTGCQVFVNNLCNFMRCCDRCSCCSSMQVGGNYTAGDHSFVQTQPGDLSAITEAAKKALSSS